VPYLFFLIWTTSYFAFLHYSIGGAQPISVGCCSGLKLCPSIWLLSAPIWRWFVLPPLRGVLHVGHGYPYLYLVMAPPSQFLFMVVTISAYQPDNLNLPEMLGLGQWDLKYLFGYHLELPCSLWRSLGLIRPMRLLSGTGLEDGTAVWIILFSWKLSLLNLESSQLLMETPCVCCLSACILRITVFFPSFVM
jgi:hypothetical protein